MYDHPTDEQTAGQNLVYLMRNIQKAHADLNWFATQICVNILKMPDANLTTTTLADKVAFMSKLSQEVDISDVLNKAADKPRPTATLYDIIHGVPSGAELALKLHTTARDIATNSGALAILHGQWLRNIHQKREEKRRENHTQSR